MIQKQTAFFVTSAERDNGVMLYEVEAIQQTELGCLLTRGENYSLYSYLTPRLRGFPPLSFFCFRILLEQKQLKVN